MKRIILSSGRSGSTWLAKLLNEINCICVISDLIEPCGHNFILNKEVFINGQEFDLLLNHSSHKERSWYWNKESTIERLYIPTEKKEYSLLESYTIPFLNLDVEDTLTKITQMLRTRNDASCKDHLLSVFDLLTSLSGSQNWIERTGGSLMESDKVIRNFPEAKYIVLERNFETTSKSMANYPFFRLYHRLKHKEALQYAMMYEHVEPQKFMEDIKRDNEKCYSFLNEYGCRYQTIKYEDLVMDTHSILSLVCGFFEINTTKEDIESAINKFPPKK